WPLLPFRKYLFRDRAFPPLAGHDEHSGQIDEDSCPSEQGQNDEADAKDGRGEVEVAAQTATDSGEHPIGRAPLEPPYNMAISDVFGHAPSLPRPRTLRYPEFPWSHPHPAKAYEAGASSGAAADRMARTSRAASGGQNRLHMAA